MANSVGVSITNQVIGTRFDPRSVSDLIDVALEADEDAAWIAIAALHWRGSQEVLDRAITLTRACDPALRGRGADILSQLGVPERTFPDECFSAAHCLLVDEVETVICDAIYALGHIDKLRAAPVIIPFSLSEDCEIRHAVAFGLCGVETPEAVETLLILMSDCDADVRNWATFGIGQQCDADSQKIRAALANALSDDDEDVRYEAVIGMGKRRDRRALGCLITLLHEDPDNLSANEAAAMLLGIDEIEEIKIVDLLDALQRSNDLGREV